MVPQSAAGVKGLSPGPGPGARFRSPGTLGPSFQIRPSRLRTRNVRLFQPSRHFCSLTSPMRAP